VNQPVIYIEPGIQIATWLPDFHGQDSRMRVVSGGPNPLVGPFFINGAQPGDTLSVTIHALTPNRTQGFACMSLHPRMNEPPLPDSARVRDYVTWQIDAEKQVAVPQGGFFPGGQVELPLKPVLGCIGVAPGGASPIPSIDCADHGGNMDYPRIAAGCTLHLPVFVEGGYLYLGDAHALQGDGEITGNGIEISCDITFSTRLNQVKVNSLSGEDDEYLFTISNSRPLEKALRLATAAMHAWLQNRYGLSQAQVGILLGQQVRYEVGNLVSNAFTGACCFPRSALPRAD
jgi:acetamidase/formamidase